MSPKVLVKSELEEMQDELAALQTDLPKIQDLLQSHTDAADQARRDKADWETQAALQAKQSGFESVLRQHRDEIRVAEARITELQHQAQREETLAIITRASARYPEIKSELEQIFAQADAALYEAIQKAKLLADEGNEHLRLAGRAVNQLIGAGDTSYARDQPAREETYQRAVEGTDTPALSTYTTDFQPWPADWGGSPYKAIHLFDPYRMSHAVQIDTPVDTSEHDELREAFVQSITGASEGATARQGTGKAG